MNEAKFTTTHVRKARVHLSPEDLRNAAINMALAFLGAERSPKMTFHVTPAPTGKFPKMTVEIIEELEGNDNFEGKYEEKEDIG